MNIVNYSLNALSYPIRLFGRPVFNKPRAPQIIERARPLFVIQGKLLNGDIIEVELEDPTVTNFKKGIREVLQDDIDKDDVINIFDEVKLDDREHMREDKLYLIMIDNIMTAIYKRFMEVHHHFVSIGHFLYEFTDAFKKNRLDPEFLATLESYETEMQRFHQQYEITMNNILAGIPTAIPSGRVCACMKRYIKDLYKVAQVELFKEENYTPMSDYIISYLANWIEKF